MSAPDNSNRGASNSVGAAQHLESCIDKTENFIDSLEEMRVEAEELKNNLTSLKNEAADQNKRLNSGDFKTAGKEGQEVAKALQNKVADDIKTMASQLEVELSVLEEIYGEASQAKTAEEESIEDLREKISG